MTAPADEQAQDGRGDFRDLVDVQLLDDSLLVAARIARAPARGSTAVAALVIADGEPAVELTDEAGAVDSWERAAAGPLRFATEERLARWTSSLDAPGAQIELELRAITGPVDISEAGTASIGRVTGVRRYTQLCHARGSAEVSGRRRAIDAIALRTHRWGTAAATGRTRFLTAATAEGSLLSLAAAPAHTGAPHGEELVGGHTTPADDGGTVSLETVRLSTVFGSDGEPVSTGAELFRPGDELPSRLAGVAAGTISSGGDGARTSLSLFRFRMDGVPALGSYEIETHT